MKLTIELFDRDEGCIHNEQLEVPSGAWGNDFLRSYLNTRLGEIFSDHGFTGFKIQLELNEFEGAR